MAIGKLTNILVKNAKFKDKKYKLTDAEGMYLLVNKTGKYWRMDYRFAGKRKTYSLGVYPEVSLKEAREKRQTARQLLHSGIDPMENKKIAKNSLIEAHENSFECIARSWYKNQSSVWVDAHAKRVESRLEKDIYPWLGKRPISEITPKEILTVLQRVEQRGAIETAHRLKGYISDVFQYSLAHDLEGLTGDPAATLSKALKPKPKANNNYFKFNYFLCL